MTTSKWSVVLGSSLILFALSACSTSKVPEVPIEEQWRKTIHNFSLIPIYPMRENVFIGDARLTVDPSVVQPGILPYRNIGYIDLTKALETYYKARPEFPPITRPENDNELVDMWEQPKLGDKESIFGRSGKVNRPRLAALPGISVATTFQGSIGGRAPVEGVGNVGAGVAGESSRVLNISLTGIEEVEAPSDFAVKQAFDKTCKEQEHKGFFSADSLLFALRQMIGDSTPELLEQAKPQIAVISRVFYARSVEYTFQTNQGIGADVVAVTEGLKALQELSSSLGAEPRLSGDNTKTVDPADPETEEATEGSAAATQAEVAKIAAMLRSRLTGSSSPGVAVSAVFVDARGVTLSQTFERPLAFGVQIVAYDLRGIRPGRTCAEMMQSGAYKPDRVLAIPPFKRDTGPK